MTLAKTTEEDKIEIVGTHKAIQIRTATVITDSGTEISRSFSRRVIHPCVKSGDPAVWSDYDTSSESTEVQGIASAVWTSAVKTAYKTAMDAQSI